MPRRTKEEAEQTRQLLLATALRMFAEQGIARTSLKDIAAEAGLTHGALYWHFKNRTDLVAALYDECRFPIDELFLDQLQAARQDALASLAGFIEDWCQLILTDDQAGRIWSVFHYNTQHDPELIALMPLIEEEHQEWLSLLAKIIKKARKQKQIPYPRKGKTDPLPGAALSVVMGVVSCLKSTRGLAARKKQIRATVHSFVYGLNPD
ncbi:MAG: hypothetical protein CSA61_02270 [Neptuniibacter caesariensis]|uniref:HTH tetR-type domain-containing protein n=1 Tax=Neptuniibacter caesariensis TaxID=207954 RepID=A0A2G6JD14_NEPCE|nr:MAG: hypothetical protein CSA61_02270 [Neptuniibacter caesariensis]